MPGPQLFDAVPEVLVKARERRGLDVPDAARLLRLQEGDLRDFEAGKSIPVTLLERMAAKYHVSLATLVSDVPPTPPRAALHDFRTILGREPELTGETQYVINEVQAQREDLAALLLEADEPLGPELPILHRSLDDPAFGGEATRQRLGITDDMQLTWPDAGEAFRAWRLRMEDEGVLVFVRDMPRRDCRGFSVVDDSAPPAIVVNGEEVEQAKLFTLLHEYAHLLVRRPGICDERSRARRASYEAYCNQFAGAALLSPTVIRRAADDLGMFIPRRIWTETEVRKLATRLRVSRHTLAIRLENLRLGPKGMFAELREQWRNEAWRHPRKNGRPSPVVRALNRLGTRFVETVLDAHAGTAISGIDADRMMGIRRKHFGSLRDEIEHRRERLSGRGA